VSDDCAGKLRIELDFNSTRNKLVQFLEHRKDVLMVLATSADSRVLSRTVWVANDQLSTYFFTWAFSRKCSQISANPQVSLCRDKVEIEGTARVVGPMFSPETADILALFTAENRDDALQWQDRPSMVIYRVDPTFACVDVYKEQGEIFYEYLDFTNEVAYKENWAYR